MAQSSSSFHESLELLHSDTMDRHRAIVSLMEEFEAVDWYDQRVDAAGDSELKGLLAHNRDEEKEHAAMLLEWLRRRDPGWDTQLRNYLFKAKPVLEVEEAIDKAAAHAEAGESTLGCLGIGSLRGEAKR